METTLATDQRSAYEIERGKPMPGTVHAFVQKNLIVELEIQFRQRFTILPEVSIETAGKTTVPDIAIYPRFEIDVRHDVIHRTDFPLATIEILSPTQNLQELIDKTERYFALGVRSCWVVLPALKAVVLYYEPGKYHFFSENDRLKDPNSGIELPLGGIFK
jgi:Uma2 family endonuclease